jgi:hypothetical protein
MASETPDMIRIVFGEFNWAETHKKMNARFSRFKDRFLRKSRHPVGGHWQAQKMKMLKSYDS